MLREASLRSADEDELIRLGRDLFEALTIIGGRVPSPALGLILQLDLPVDSREVT